MEMLRINGIVRCQKSMDLTKPFIGQILKLNHDYVTVTILHHEPCDRYVVQKIKRITNVSRKELAPIKIKKADL